MDVVMLERRLDPPAAMPDVQGMQREAAWCMEQYRVQHRTSLLSLDGRLLLCAFDAPDAEAVRSVLHQVGAPYERIWSASVHAPADFACDASLATAGTIVVVERDFDVPVELASLQDVEDRGAWCLERHRVRFLRSFFARDRRRMVCAYAAPDAEAVRDAQRQAGMPFASAWAATAYETPATP